MLRPIVLFGAEVLDKPAELVTNISDDEIRLVQDMIETMYQAPGVGLAANQVGVGKAHHGHRSIGRRETEPTDHASSIRRSLSQRASSTKKRAVSVFLVSARPLFVRSRSFFAEWTLNGKEITVEGKDLLARAFCHEMDHLNGVFFLEHLSFIKRDMIKRKIRKLMKQGEWESNPA